MEVRIYRVWVSFGRILGAFLFLALAAEKARAWSAERQAFPGSIKAVTAVVGQGPAVVRTLLSDEENQASMTFEIALRLRNFAELQSRIAAGETIAPAEMRARYFPLPGDYANVVQWTQDQGFSIVYSDPNGLALFARGPVAAVAQAFQVSFARVNFRGAEYTAAVTSPSLPVDFAAAVAGIHGLQPYIRLHPVLAYSQLADSDSSGYTPSQIAAAYNASALGVSGSGQTIALVEQGYPSESDLQAFWSDADVSGASTNNITEVNIDGGPGSSPGSSNIEEATLDAEWTTGLAPGAQVRIYGVNPDDTGGFDQAYQQIYADATNTSLNLNLHQFSISFGENEDEIDTDYFTVEAQYMAELASAGVAVFAAAGDGGSRPDPDTGSYKASDPLTVDYPASDPSVTGVGGTALTLAGSTVSSEVAWADGGGGVSAEFSRPAWQTGTGVPSGTTRCVPDVSSSADPDLGALVVFDGQEVVLGGTSWSTPTWAAFCALINSARATAGKAALGYLNPKLYPLIASSETASRGSTGSAFWDITLGSNDGVQYPSSGGDGEYTAGTGYDLCTGIGVPDVYQLHLALLNVSASGAPVVTEQLGGQFTTVGQTATFAIAAEGTPTLSFQWQQSTNGGSTWTDLSDGAAVSGSATSTLALFDVTAAMSGYEYQCVVSNGSGQAVSTPAALTVGSNGVTTLAGWPDAAGFVNATGRAARFAFPGSVRADSSGNIYVADGANNAVREISPAGVVTTVAGVAGTAGDVNGPVASAEFNEPAGVAVDPSGNLYVADSGNNQIREISISNGTFTTVSTLAGSGAQGTAGGTGTNAEFYDLQNLVYYNGVLYIADGSSNTIRQLVIATQEVSTLAGGGPSRPGFVNGTGTNALFNDPCGLGVDSSGNIYVADTGNNAIREITPGGVVTTVAGSGASGSADGSGSTAQFDAPTGVTADSLGNLYVADANNGTVREISPVSGGGWEVSTLAGKAGDYDNVDGLLDASSPSATIPYALFSSPADVALDSGGNIYIADSLNYTVRRIVLPSAPSISGQPQSLTVATGAAAVFTVTANNADSYQWYDNGVAVADGGAVAGATTSQLLISGATAANAGNYYVVVTGFGGQTVTSGTVALAVESGSANAGTLAALSTRAEVGTGADLLIGGFVVGGSTSRTVLILAVGPGLQNSFSNYLPAPTLTLISNGQTIYSNTGWDTGGNGPLLQAEASLVSGTTLTPGVEDSALLVTLPPGAYTAEVTGANGSTGIAVVSIYQLP